MTTTVIRKASELRNGDVVVTHGMRVLLDAPIRSYDDRGTTVYSCHGLVLNPEAVEALTDRFLWWAINDSRDNGEHRWTVQSNDLHHGWAVEVPAAAPVGDFDCCTAPVAH